jgi:hypothetical protein
MRDASMPQVCEGGSIDFKLQCVQGLQMNGAVLPQQPLWQPEAPAKPLGQGWVHESELPLWIVKRYEETSRQAAAMESARQAREALLCKQPWHLQQKTNEGGGNSGQGRCSTNDDSKEKQLKEEDQAGLHLQGKMCLCGMFEMSTQIIWRVGLRWE